MKDLTKKTDEQIQIAKDFIGNHKNNNAEEWLLRCQPGTDDDKYLEIYAKLESGVFGECRTDAEYDDDGEIVKEASEFEIEISRSESKNGNAIIFNWES